MPSTEAPVRKVRVSDLRVDHSYQRPLSPGRRDSIAGKWSDRKAGVISVSDRGRSGVWVIDGQHRTAAAEQHGRQWIKAEVWTGLSVAEEAEMFDSLNDARARVDPLSRFRAQLRYGDGVAVAIKETVEDCGAEIQPHTASSRYQGIRAVDTLRKIFTRSGREGLTWVLTTIADCYEQADYTTATQRLLGGLEIVYANDVAPSDGRFDQERLVRRLGEEGLLALNRLAATNSQIFGGYGSKNVYRAICEIVNKGLSADSSRRIGGEVRIKAVVA